MRGWLVALWLGAAACSGDGAFEVARWRLVTEGVEQPIELPAHLDSLMPARPTAYTLSTELEVPADLRGRPLTLTVAAFPAIVDLYVDGRRAEALESSVTERYRSPGWHAWRVPSDPAPRRALELR